MENGDSMTLLKFWAPWCGPCKNMAPAVASALEKYASIELKDVNVDEDPDTATVYKVRAIPTLILLKDGSPEGRLVGARSPNEIEEFLSEHQS